MNTMSTGDANSDPIVLTPNSLDENTDVISVKTPIKPKPRPRPKAKAKPKPKAKAKAKPKPKPSSPRTPPSTKPHTLEWIVPPKPRPFSLPSPAPPELYYRNYYYGSTVVGSKHEEKGGPSCVMIRTQGDQPAHEPSSAAAAAAFDHVQNMECLESYVIDDDVRELLSSDWLNDSCPPRAFSSEEDFPLTGIWDY